MDATWPLSPERHILVVTLGELIRRFGAARFGSTRLVAANTTDFPDPWAPTLRAVHDLIYRLCWHARVDAEVVVEDAREAIAPNSSMLTDTSIELVDVRAGCATYRLHAIGNDDVAGLVAHSIGQIFVELAPGEPFRDGPRETSDVDHSIAAIYVGLGVLVANASMVRRHAQRWEGRRIATEERIQTRGGLAIGDAMMLLAIQDLLRDDAQPALDTLHEPQQEWLAAWRDVLGTHEDALRVLLGLDDAESGVPRVPERPATPRRAPAHDEPDLRKINRGQITFRVRRGRLGLPIMGTFAGYMGGAWLTAVWLSVPSLVLGIVGVVAGRLLAGKRYMCSEPECQEQMAGELATCPRCGGTIAETLSDVRLRLERREQLQLPAGAPTPEDEL